MPLAMLFFKRIKNFMNLIDGSIVGATSALKTKLLFITNLVFF